MARQSIVAKGIRGLDLGKEPPWLAILGVKVAGANVWHCPKLVFSEERADLAHAAVQALSSFAAAEVVGRLRLGRRGRRVPQGDAKVACAFDAVDRGLGAVWSALPGLAALLELLATRARLVVHPVEGVALVLSIRPPPEGDGGGLPWCGE